MTEANTKKNLKKNSDGHITKDYHFNYAFMLAVVSLVLLAIAFGALYFIFFVEKTIHMYVMNFIQYHLGFSWSYWPEEIFRPLIYR